MSGFLVPFGMMGKIRAGEALLESNKAGTEASQAGAPAYAQADQKQNKKRSTNEYSMNTFGTSRRAIIRQNPPKLLTILLCG